jgi:hypothetical protein
MESELKLGELNNSDRYIKEKPIDALLLIWIQELTIELESLQVYVNLKIQESYQK